MKGTFFLAVTMVLIVSSTGCYPENEYRITVNSLKELKSFPEPELPIQTSQEAANYAVRLDLISSSLGEAEAVINIPTSWKIHGKVEILNGDRWWNVRILSSGILPSYLCVATFDDLGNLSSEGRPLNYCGFNK